jgi:uncharacterized membrane protein
VTSSSVGHTQLRSYRLSVMSRVLAAAVGGYGLMLLFDIALSFLLPITPRNAFLYAVQSGFLIYTLVIIWAFAARTATKAWLGLLLVAVPLALVDGYYYWQGYWPGYWQGVSP